MINSLLLAYPNMVLLLSPHFLYVIHEVNHVTLSRLPSGIVLLQVM